MLSFFRRQISLKVVLPLIAVLAVLMIVFGVYFVRERTRAVESLLLTKARNLVLVGATTMEKLLSEAVKNGELTHDQLFDTDYQQITEGPLAYTDPPKFHTRYDRYFDEHFQEILDRFAMEDPSVVFAILADRNGYVPTHNQRYSQPLNGEEIHDRDNNRTKRIFDDPVGLKAVRFLGSDQQPVLRQIYERDTGEVMWDLSAPVMVDGQHWGAFRLGLLLAETEQSIIRMRETIFVSTLLMLLVSSLTIVLVVRRILQPLVSMTQSVEHLADGKIYQGFQMDSNDEIGKLIKAFNKMSSQLQQTTVSRDYYDCIVESMREAMMIISSEGLIKSANQSTCALLGYSCEELVDQPVEVILPSNWQKGAFNINDFSKPTLLMDKNDRGCFFLIAKSGKKIAVSLSSSPMLDDDGGVLSLIWVAQDITQRREMERRLQQAFEESWAMAENLEEQNLVLSKSQQKLEEAYAELKASQLIILQQEKMASVGLLAAGMAHEVNNPIGFINSNLNSLKKYLEKMLSFIEAQEKALNEFPDSEGKQEVAVLRKKLKLDFLLEDCRELIDESLNGAERVRNLVQNLKTFSRADQAEEAKVDLNDCLESTISIIWNELKYKVTLNRDYGELPLTLCYAQKMNQVFMNILVNAAHSIDKKGEITIKTRHEDDHIRIWITDTGCGIPEENLKKIFEPFYTTKEVGTGTGLGMSIAYEIIEQHQGKIYVTSEVGGGTTFMIDLPVAE
ncbi:PAS domain S-box protein [Desulfuromonas acetoxidans]|nr:ATP-binding protein [Desulfuromonas acetoxidans]MBF0645578.1 PAS domain S-box protein [Desulfuromonas acetoxidans]NVD23380.1 PAS domain S-box protein [Desulfuromonas acetoxidans]NVE15379.1 PAS domain S-box protein [Desulfuromonas acetoxidans]